MIEFTRIVQEFSKLGKIFLGGTKGRTLTDSLRQAHKDFDHAVERFHYVKYDHMDINSKRFDDDYYAYRCQVRRKLFRPLISSSLLLFEGERA